MALLKSAKDIPGIDFLEYRDANYYGKYQYRARFTLVGVRYTWYIKKDIEELIKRLDDSASQNIRLTYEREEVKQNLPKIDAFLHLRNEWRQKKNTTVRIEHNTVAVFCNDLQELKTIETAIPGIVVDYTQVQTSNFVGTKTFANTPKHKYRVYLKTKIVQNNLIKDLKDLIDRSPDLHPCPSLDYWLQSGMHQGNINSWRYRYTSCTHFIDYDDESTLSYISLMHGDYLGKRYKLEKRPEPV